MTTEPTETEAPESDEIEPEGSNAEAEATEEAPPEPRPMRWYILRVNTGYEDQVRKSLEARIRQQALEESFGRIVVPKEEILEFRAGEKRRTKRKLYPGYVFVEMHRTSMTQSLIRDVPRVAGFVGAEDRTKDPKPLTNKEVDRLLKILADKDEQPPEVVQHFQRGEKIKIVDGAFTNFQGVVDDVRPERRKLRVLVTIFGRQTPVEVTYTQVERVE